MTRNLTARFLHRVACLLGPLALLFAATASADPPMRVARLGLADGPVSLSPDGLDDWTVARVNRPVVTGDRLWSGQGGRAEVQVGSLALRISSSTQLEILNLDDRIAQFFLAQGSLSLRVRRTSPGEVVEVSTPNLAFTVNREGWYRFDVDSRGEWARVVVFDGEGEAFGQRTVYRVPAGQGYRFYGTDLRDLDFESPPGRDELDHWARTRERLWERSASRQYVPLDMLGYADLDEYGTWRTLGTYGAVWFPTRITADWAPYRDGHWAWIDPWGWTWIDDAPWGFAPFHYGRWARIDGRWAWVPGPRDRRPVYAPALVAFVGGSSFGLSMSIGSAPAIAWFPLAPGEVYRPPYVASRDYFTRINVSNTIINQTVVNNYYNAPTRIEYVYQRQPIAVTAVPVQDFAASRPVRQAALAAPQQAIARAMEQAQPSATAPVEPRRESVLGGTREARTPPPAAAGERPAIVKTPPPPVRIPFAERQQALRAEPGKPLDSDALRARRPQDGQGRPGGEVRVVEPPASTPRELPPGQARPRDGAEGGPPAEMPAEARPGGRQRPADTPRSGARPLGSPSAGAAPAASAEDRGRAAETPRGSESPGERPRAPEKATSAPERDETRRPSPRDERKAEPRDERKAEPRDVRKAESQDDKKKSDDRDDRKAEPRNDRKTDARDERKGNSRVDPKDEERRKN